MFNPIKVFANYFANEDNVKKEILINKNKTTHMVHQLSRWLVLASMIKHLVLTSYKISFASKYKKQNKFSFIAVDDLNNNPKTRFSFLKLFCNSKNFESINYEIFYVSNFSEKIKSLVKFLTFATQVFIFIPIFLINKRKINDLRNIFFAFIRSRFIEQHMSTHKINKIFIFQMCYFENTCVSSYLTSKGFHVNLNSPSHLEFDDKYIIASNLYLGSKYQIDEYHKYKNNFSISNCYYWGPENSPQLKKYNDSNRSKQINKIGIYTQGIWLRSKFDFYPLKLYDIELNKENQFMQLIRQIASENPDFEFEIFPHPIERKEALKSKKHFSALFSKNKNILVNFETSSLQSFKIVGLGVTIYSTIGFDRIECGFRTIFFNPSPSLLNPEKKYVFYDIITKSEQEFIEKLKYWRIKSNLEFIKKFEIVPLNKRIDLIKNQKFNFKI